MKEEKILKFPYLHEIQGNFICFDDPRKMKIQGNYNTPEFQLPYILLGACDST